MKSKGALHNLLNPPVVVLAGGILAAAPSPRVEPAAKSFREVAPARLQHFHHEHVLGTSLELKVAASPEHARRAQAAVLAEIARLAEILSAYQAGSEFSLWQSSLGPGRVSPELFEVLDLYDFWRMRTGGALNASAEAATRLWRECARDNRLPSEGEKVAVTESARGIHWELDRAARTAVRLTDTPLTLNSVGKPYIADRAAALALASPGVNGVVVNIGGDLVVRGALQEPVRISDPQSDAENSPALATLMVSNRAVATSGGYRRGFEIGGRRYSHIIDPRNSEAVDHVLSASVVAPKAADAGALATAFSVLPVAESQRLAATLPDVDYLLVARNGRRITSAGWSALSAAAAAPSAVPPQTSSSTWDPSFELAIGLELPRFQEMPYYRPYVAIWIEDKDKALVRTLALWYDQAFWLHELRAWSRAYQARPTAEKPSLASISSATRPAGKYSFKWDGKDNRGNLVKAGSYTVCVEVVRQNAEYEIIRQPMDFARVPKAIQLAGRLEVSSVSLQYRRIHER